MGGDDIEIDDQAIARFQRLVPRLGGNYKGAHGKVAVVGGCLEFTGAPFFAAMSALRVGADMAYVICTPSAATAIKCYSPELMVLPYLPEMPPGEEDGPVDEAAVARAVSRILPWISRASAVVLMLEIRRLGLPLVVDGSALTHIVAKASFRVFVHAADTVIGYRPCILTPNVAELGRIAEAVGLQLPGQMSDAWLEHAPRVAQAFRGPVVLAKGKVDLLCGPGDHAGGGAGAGGSNSSAGGGDAAGSTSGGALLQPLLRCSSPGSQRRCGGQGDVLAGTAAAFLGWASKHKANAQRAGGEATGTPPLPPPSPQQQQQQQQPPRSPMPQAPPQTPAEGEAGNGAEGLDTDTVALCGYAACKVVREAARRAYNRWGRPMLAGDMIPELYPAFVQTVGKR
ncbi:hypothetical protein VOLCADRAFT_116306 [Volvox carteri f. nagariensis]|uniref:ATP-dependent (S)-NAD(P)H-hydrate dehydratase n=1 Tax=Volvox carteri f. nagariensis TaxID=3068 RepID=D8TL15_VOLCA|nr:uncharacterized protein VOLCADRAFT_116306 [Volvox carteri f. nagariensis]EFJ51794.1 hypothetical protein VOLCADRAFT_116306 [Volvox carteri f. nagariensis]|eukprot:XP_002947204.1 hypothetical protein VOLCADRAFT_116306 [Volvox carteri f. nagariensis]